MTNASFSLSISSRGNDFVVGGSGSLDLEGATSMRQSIEDSCKKEGSSVLLDLTLVSELRPEAVAILVEVAGFCRERGVPFSVSVGPNVAKILTEAGFDSELSPISGR